MALKSCEQQQALCKVDLTDQITNITLVTEKGSISAPSSKSMTPCPALPCPALLEVVSPIELELRT